MIAIGESVIRSVKVSKMYFAAEDDEDSGNESAASHIAMIESYMQHSPTFSPTLSSPKVDTHSLSRATPSPSSKIPASRTVINAPHPKSALLLNTMNDGEIEKLDYEQTTEPNSNVSHPKKVLQPLAISSATSNKRMEAPPPSTYTRAYSAETSVSLPISLSFSMFSKEPIPPPTSRPPVSCLSRELSESGLFRSTRTHSASSSPRLSFTQQRMLKDSTLIVSVFFRPGTSPMKLFLRQDVPVYKLIDMILTQYRDEQKQPPLRFDNPEAYDLRVLDDDDGTPDEDLPPLDRLRDFAQYGVDSIAICESLTSPATVCETLTTNSYSFSGNMARLSRTQSATALKNSFNCRIQLKVHIDDERGSTDIHVLSLNSDLCLSDVVSLIAKKKMTQMQPEHYKFVYWSNTDEISDYSDTGSSRVTVYNEQHDKNGDEQSYTASNVVPDDDEQEIHMRMLVGELLNDELRLINRLESPRRTPLLVGSSSPVMDPVPEHFIFSLESASTYSEYRVIKTNERGKRQVRMLGIDAVKIYNKHVTKNGHRRRIMEVMRAYRAIKSVIGVVIHPENALCFTIYFREKGKSISREYEAETKMECAEIVAKIRFLSSHQIKFST